MTSIVSEYNHITFIGEVRVSIPASSVDGTKNLNGLKPRLLVGFLKHF